MKIKISLIIIAFSVLNLYCAGIQISGPDVKEMIQTAADSIKKDKNNVYKLDNAAIGRSGYYYIIRNNGTVSYHPKKALINYDFSGFPFVQKILKQRNGCITSGADGMQRYIFFAEIDSSEILCLTIENSEFTEPVYDCN